MGWATGARGSQRVDSRARIAVTPPDPHPLRAMKSKDKVLIANMPTVDPKARALVINKLLMAEKIDLFNGKDGLLYRKREPSKAGAIAGDQEEKVVYKEMAKVRAKFLKGRNCGNIQQNWKI